MDMAWNNQLHSRAEILAGLPKRPPTGIALSEMQVSLRGDRALVRGVNTATKPGGHLIGRVRFADIFRYRGGMWQALTAQEVLMR
jgi:hypothetical protein